MKGHGNNIINEIENNYTDIIKELEMSDDIDVFTFKVAKALGQKIETLPTDQKKYGIYHYYGAGVHCDNEFSAILLSITQYRLKCIKKAKRYKPVDWVRENIKKVVYKEATYEPCVYKKEPRIKA